MSTDLFGTNHTSREALGSHQSASGGSDEWLTPPSLIHSLGAFDLDPCSPRVRPWDTAAKHYNIEDDGLRQEWSGRVWLNPPYAHAAKWLHRLSEHGHGTALIFARTETALWFDHVWPRASGLLFLRGRLHFHYGDGRRAKANSGAPSVLVAYGATDAAVLASHPIPGRYVPIDSGVVRDPATLAGDDALVERLRDEFPDCASRGNLRIIISRLAAALTEDPSC